VRNEGITGITINEVGAYCGEGDAVLRAVDNTSLTFTPPDGDEGEKVTIAANETRVVHGKDRDKWIRVSRGDIQDLLPRTTTMLNLTYRSGNAIAMTTFDLADASSLTRRWRCVVFKNRSSQTIQDLRFWITPIGAAVLLDEDTAAASGPEEVRIDGDLSGWPGARRNDHAGAVVQNLDRASGGINCTAAYIDVIWESRQPAKLVLPISPSRARAYLDNSPALNWSRGDRLVAIPPIGITYEAPSSQPTGNFSSTPAEDQDPAPITSSDLKHPTSATHPEIIQVPALASGEIGALWICQLFLFLSYGVVEARPYNTVSISYQYAI
jgi:hypothetical protein